MNIKEELNNLTIRKTMNTVEINKSIMELNYKKEKLQNEVDIIQEQIYFLASLRESQRPTEDDNNVIDESLLRNEYLEEKDREKIVKIFLNFAMRLKKLPGLRFQK